MYVYLFIYFICFISFIYDIYIYIYIMFIYLCIFLVSPLVRASNVRGLFGIIA